MGHSSPARSDSSVLRPGRVVVGVLVFLALSIAVPIGWFVGQVPLAFTRTAVAFYGVTAAAASAAIVSTADRSDRPALTFAAAFAGFAAVVLLVLGSFWALDTVVSNIDFSLVTETRVPCPTGRLVAVARDVDQGALGADCEVFVRARLLPGVVSWDYSVTFQDYVDNVRWDGCERLIVDGKPYSIPWVIRASAW